MARKILGPLHWMKIVRDPDPDPAHENDVVDIDIEHAGCETRLVGSPGDPLSYEEYVCDVDQIFAAFGWDITNVDPHTLPEGRYQLRAWVEHYPGVWQRSNPETEWGIEILNADGTEIEEGEDPCTP